jgi:hypothetical protein
METFQKRALREIAGEIEADWLVINNQAAKHALDYMKMMASIESPFAADPNGWKGDVARRVKKELRAMCGHPRP